MTGIPSGHWAGKFVAVCDPEPPPERPGARREVEKRLRGDRLISAREAMARASAGLRAYELNNVAGWSQAIAGKRMSQPQLVKRLDRSDDYYYIVPMGGTESVPTAAVSVDARFGIYRQSIVFKPRSKSSLSMIDRKTAAQLVLGNWFELPNREGRLLVRREAVCHYPLLVWKPCRESLSPFYPFHMFSVGAHRVYVRVDGAVFTELHDQDKGI